MVGLCTPLPTLRRRPCRRLRTAQGRCGSLLLHRKGLAGSIPAFAAGSALWGTALLLISIPKLFAAPVRFLGIVSAVLFIITSARIFWGEQLLPTSTPLPTHAYPLLVATFVGWIWTLWREPA